MFGLAASVAFAGSVFLAALRLLTRRDKVHRRTYVLVTRTFVSYLLIHGVGAIVPFFVYWLWPNNWSPLFTASPWLVAILSPLVVNQMLTLKGLDFPDATGPLSRFGDDLRRDFEQRMLDEQFAAMRGFIAPYAQGVSYSEAHTLAWRHKPMGLPAQQQDDFRQAIDAVTTAEEVMELYIRHIGMHSFRFFFKKRDNEDLAQLVLFPEGEGTWQPRARSGIRT